MWCYRFLSPPQIHRPRPDLNPRSLGPMASTLTTRQVVMSDISWSYVVIFRDIYIIWFVNISTRTTYYILFSCILRSFVCFFLFQCYKCRWKCSPIDLKWYGVLRFKLINLITPDKQVTKFRVRDVGTPAWHSGGPGSKSRPRDRLPSHVSVVFPSSDQMLE
jgi:hypothetical protein